MKPQFTEGNGRQCQQIEQRAVDRRHLQRQCERSAFEAALRRVDQVDEPEQGGPVASASHQPIQAPATQRSVYRQDDDKAESRLNPCITTDAAPAPLPNWVDFGITASAELPSSPSFTVPLRIDSAPTTPIASNQQLIDPAIALWLRRTDVDQTTNDNRWRFELAEQNMPIHGLVVQRSTSGRLRVALSGDSSALDLQLHRLRRRLAEHGAMLEEGGQP